VIGVTLQLYDHGAGTGRRAPAAAGQDIHDARRVADHLGISITSSTPRHGFAPP